MPVLITIANIEDFRGKLTLKPGDLSDNIWAFFDHEAFISQNGRLVDLKQLISTKNELIDPKFLAGAKQDPRQTAFEFMQQARMGLAEKRMPIKVRGPNSLGMYHIVDGNATAQVLMLLHWGQLPIQVEQLRSE